MNMISFLELSFEIFICTEDSFFIWNQHLQTKLYVEVDLH